ncbi:hypothetical protein BABA_06921 [Neobacillus bataviensis LMG 21833]|uniref:Uncharacterized protein n=1 Tax=Neobacillus bataviensis LMG 21833 TaxID=1117379 RepID=K6DP44_9BACI|nr:hypothetical protein [Neobacillus bataviensis]EKN70089.1 hypothetical protein BABA_06921 [Neobacillus bataviensis LMG 21833]
MKFKIYRCNCRKVWSIQNRKSKVSADTLLINGKWDTELKPERRSNPKGFVTTIGHNHFIFNPAREILEQYDLVAKLVYDKTNVEFNVNNGEYLYFAEDGACYMLRKMIK